MPGYVALPAYRPQGSINFDPLNEGLDDLSKQFEKNRLLRQAQQVGAALAPDTVAQAPQNPLLAPSNVPASPAQASAAAAGRDFPTSGTDYSPAIKGIESGGNYKAVGPVTASGDRAYGAHQVMGTNIPVWTKEVLGQSLTPQQYLDNPDAQEKVFRAKFGQYVAKTGNPQDAASMWFTGKPLAQGANRQDLYGTTGNEYVRRFDAASGGAPAAPAQVAPAPSGPNYRKAAAKAFEFGNVALGTQLLQQQQELDNQTYTRGRQARQDVLGQQRWQADYGLQSAQNTRAEASAGREKTAFEDAQHKAAIAHVGALAAAVAAEPDPARQTSMWKSLVATDPEIAQGLQKNGIDPNDVASGTRFMINLARGPVTPKLTEVSPGATLFDENARKPVYSAPAKPDAASVPSGYRLGADGRSLEFIPGGPADPATKAGRDKFNESQLTSSNFANMMVTANQKLEAMSPKDALGARLTDASGNPVPMENPKNFLGAVRDSVVPFEDVRNKMTPGDTQAYNQNAAQWIRAKLRKESGASIPPAEMAQEFATYFPQYGDGPETLKQKADSRAEATKGMIAQAGGAYEHYFVKGGDQPAASGAKPKVSQPTANMPEGARKAPDGNWYVEQNGQFFRVDP